MKSIIIFSLILFSTVANCQDIDDLIKKGDSLLNTGSYEVAIKYYDVILKQKPNIVGIRFNRGVAYLAQRKYGLALKSFDSVIKIAPEWGIVYYYRGLSKLKILSYSETKLKKKKEKKEKKIQQDGFVFSNRKYSDENLNDEYKEREFRGKDESKQELLQNDPDKRKDYIGALKDFSKFIEIAIKTDQDDYNLKPKAYYFMGFCKYTLQNPDGGCSDIKEAKRLGFKINNEFIEYYCD